jgi:hypothetical protein
MSQSLSKQQDELGETSAREGAWALKRYVFA